MPFKPPLTLPQLQEIQASNPDNADVRALLWEPKRLRAIVVRADQLQRSISGELAGGRGIVLTALRREVKDEPCVLEHRQFVRSLISD